MRTPDKISSQITIELMFIIILCYISIIILLFPIIRHEVDRNYFQKSLIANFFRPRSGHEPCKAVTTHIGTLNRIIRSVSYRILVLGIRIRIKMNNKLEYRSYGAQ